MTSMFDDHPRGPITPLSAREAIDRHLALVQFDSLARDSNKPSERYVYHYTNLAGLRGIIDSNTLWASDYRYLNDRTEFAFGLDILEMCVAHPDSTPALSDALRQEVLFEIAMIKRSHSSTYVLSISFCEKGNVLSQWRAYGRQDGVAVGFDRAHLSTRAATQGFASGPIHYYWSEPPNRNPEDRFSTWLNRRCELLAATLSGPDLAQAAEEPARHLDDGDAEMDHINVRARRLTQLQSWIAGTAAFIKHPAFEEELEWRCVLIIENEGVRSGTPIKDRSSGSKLIPYVDFRLNDDQDRFTGIKQIVVGPTNDPSAVSHAVGHVTRNLALRDGFRIVSPFHPLKA